MKVFFENGAFLKGENRVKTAITQIRKSYGKKQVLEDISLDMTGGKCIGILGANGCGKSTLFSILAGVQRSDSGSFLYEGTDLLTHPTERTRHLGYVPQNTPLLEELTALDNLRLWYDGERLKQELENGVLKMLGISDFLKTRVSKMSGGMKKRLAIGCAISAHPDILLLDEPSAALDLVCKEHISDYLTDFKKNGGLILLATHDVQDLSLCDDCYILREGTLHPFTYDGNLHTLVRSL